MGDHYERVPKGLSPTACEPPTLDSLHETNPSAWVAEMYIFLEISVSCSGKKVLEALSKSHADMQSTWLPTPVVHQNGGHLPSLGCLLLG